MYDAVVVVAPSVEVSLPPAIKDLVHQAAAVDRRFGQGVSLLVTERMAGGRLIFSGTGLLDGDTDDVRSFAEAAGRGVMRARDAGARRPVILIAGVPERARYAHAHEVGALGALGALWEPLEAREALGEQAVEPIESVALVVPDGIDGATLCARVEALEAARRVARDICGTEPERMSPIQMATYCEKVFAGTCVRVDVLKVTSQLMKHYPLLMAVARASLPVRRHHPRVVRLVYQGDGPVRRSFFFAGKGLSYDTGGADVKAGGHMAGMSRDKGGAAAVAGLFLAAAHLKPPGIRMVAELGCVRNSIGAESFVTDEIIRSHSGCRVRIGNTDAEGRLVMADLLSHLRLQASKSTNPHVFSVATLTGHAGRAVGPYSIAMDNGPAMDGGMARSLEQVGDLWGDPFAVSRLRREDFLFVRPRTRADDVLSCNSAPSTQTPRGHQFPMAFLAVASGLVRHGRAGGVPIPYTHLDIGGSGVVGGDWQHGRPSGAPVVALAQQLF
ncbi:MAG: peptidase M17 [Deltaproteobacteria bacterium]|nr:peptidase M17 [Deltaproteobacteria bacterium]HCH63375.1 peptidase M17 [Deltaproteobacteria bacterium]